MDAAGEPTRAAWTASYDGLGRRLSSGRGPARWRFHWDGERLGAEVSPDGRVRVYVYPSEEARVPWLFVDYASVESAPESGRVYAVFTDQAGMPTHVEDATGRLVWSGTPVDAYGGLAVDPSSELEFHLRWPGHRYDPDTGLHDNRYRAYDPMLGRYLQTDPLGVAGGVNTYAYAPNPLVQVDVLGLAHDGVTPPTHASGTPPTATERLRDSRGRFASDPDAPSSGRIGRDDVYPSSFRQSTHHEMSIRHTDEGRAHMAAHEADPAVVPRPPPVRADAGTGEPLARDEMTWRGADGEEIPFYSRDANGEIRTDRHGRPITNLTYDHVPPLVQRYNDGGGHGMTQAGRADDFNDPDGLVPMSRSDNSSHGASLGETYRQDPPTF